MGLFELPHIAEFERVNICQTLDGIETREKLFGSSFNRKFCSISRVFVL